MKKKRDETAILPDGSEFDFWEATPLYDRRLHVCAARGDDQTGDGSPSAPFRTINAAAELATPGTCVVIHAGTYRECVNPLRGGEGPERMIGYEAAGDGEVIIKASEVITDFCRSVDYSIERDTDGSEPVIWEHTFNRDLFRGYNPFALINCIHEKNWLVYARTEMEPYLLRRGMIFVDGVPLRQVQLYRFMTDTPGSYWVEENGLKVHFRMPENDSPAEHTIEMTFREQCFVPRVPFLSYIKVKGLTFAHAANGAPVPQHGALSCRRGHHWVIEDCTVKWANAVGFDVGNEGWSLKKLPDQVIGNTVIRRCCLYDCGVCGIAGVGATNMLIEDNLIARTGWQHMEFAWESGALKFHHCKNSLFRRNIFRDSDQCAGVWLDCDNQNDRFTQNLFLHIRSPHGMLYMECNRGGETLVDNNIFWGSYFYKTPKKPEAVSIAEDNAHWNDPFDTDGVSGDGVHGDGTDDLHLANNFFGNIDGSGYSQNVVQFRMHSGRGGTSRNSIVRNNVFYDCRHSAMRLPNHDNVIDGNYYARVPQGFLRITYPAPSEALDLAAWRRFEGYDNHGGYVTFRAEVDEEQLTMTIQQASACMDWNDGGYMGYAAMPDVIPDEQIGTDFFGNSSKEKRRPGPFCVVSNESTFSIDPRKCLK